MTSVASPRFVAAVEARYPVVRPEPSWTPEQVEWLDGVSRIHRRLMEMTPVLDRPSRSRVFWETALERLP